MPYTRGERFIGNINRQTIDILIEKIVRDLFVRRNFRIPGRSKYNKESTYGKAMADYHKNVKKEFELAKNYYENLSKIKITEEAIKIRLYSGGFTRKIDILFSKGRTPCGSFDFRSMKERFKYAYDRTGFYREMRQKVQKIFPALGRERGIVLRDLFKAAGLPLNGNNKARSLYSAEPELIPT